MSLEIYSAKEGARISDADAAVAGPALSDIATRNGGKLTAEDVLDEAKGLGSPLHKFFEWDDSKAAIEHRLSQARSLIRSIEIVRVDGRGETSRVRAIEWTQKDGYAMTTEILANHDWTANLLRRFASEMDSLRKRWAAYASIREVAEVLDAIGKTSILAAQKQGEHRADQGAA